MSRATRIELAADPGQPAQQRSATVPLAEIAADTTTVDVRDRGGGLATDDVDR